MIHWITSPDHPRLDAYRRVGDPGWLRQQGVFVAEGRLVVERLIELGRYDIVSVLVNRAAHQAMLERLAALEASVYVCDDPTLASITGFNFHRGCVALVRRPPALPIESLIGGTTLLALEGVINPDNIGGIFRSAAALGADGILLDPTSGDPFYRKAVRTSMGAALRLPFVRLQNWLADLGRFRAAGFRIVALTPDERSLSLAGFVSAVPVDTRLVLCVGAEGAGLSAATLDVADARVRIPIDDAVDSLNVMVAASIALDRLRHGPDRRQPPVRPWSDSDAR
jgi:tRNA G18 (ribose-2'-O)-methylase SpoU